MPDITDLTSKIGIVAAGEFENSPEFAKPKLLAWIENLPNLSEDELFAETRHAIYESALVSRFRGNFDHEHCKASALHHLARMRLVAEGHDQWCSGPSVYGLAHAEVMRSHGYTPSPSGTCSCFTDPDRLHVFRDDCWCSPAGPSSDPGSHTGDEPQFAAMHGDPITTAGYLVEET